MSTLPPVIIVPDEHSSNHPADYTALIIMAGVLVAMVTLVAVVVLVSWGWRWFSARPRPLPRRVRNSLPIRRFSAEEGQPSACCPICLGDFAAGEELQQLPHCGHRFHLACVGRWFDTHSTCPNCRQTVVAYVPREGIEMRARGNAGGE